MITLGPAINPLVENSDEPQPSLSDLHDFEPKLEFDDTELLASPTLAHQSMYLMHMSGFSWYNNDLLSQFY